MILEGNWKYFGRSKTPSIRKKTDVDFEKEERKKETHESNRVESNRRHRRVESLEARRDV